VFGLFAIFQDEPVEARISLKAFFLQLKGQLNILQNVFFLSELRSERLFKCCPRSVIVSKLTNVRKDDGITVETQLVKAIK